MAIGIRNVSLAYLVECAHHVAREIQLRERDVHLIGSWGYRTITPSE